IDAAHVIGRVQRIPSARFVSVDDCATGDVLADQRQRSALAWHDEWQGPTKDLAGDNYHLALAGLHLRDTPIDAIGLPIGGLDVAAGIHAVDLNFAVELGLVRVMDLGTHGLAELVRQNESRFVLNVEIPAQMQSGVALGAVDEDRDRQEVIAMRQLTGMEHRSARHAELPVATLAAPDRTAPEAVHLGASTMRAIRLAAVVRPADGDEPRMRFLVRQPHDLSEGQAPCG